MLILTLADCILSDVRRQLLGFPEEREIFNSFYKVFVFPNLTYMLELHKFFLTRRGGKNILQSSTSLAFLDVTSLVLGLIGFLRRMTPYVDRSRYLCYYFNSFPIMFEKCILRLLKDI